MWRTVIYLGLSFSAVLAIPVGEKNIPIIPDNDEIIRTRSEIAMSSLNLPSNATSIRADIVDGFTCANKTYGYYADVDNDCQIFHVCLPVVYPDGKENTFRWSFICPEETLFSQESFTCVRSEDMNFGCSESERFYALNRNFGNYADTSMEVTSMEADLNMNVQELLRKPVETKDDEYIRKTTESSIRPAVDFEINPIKKIELKKEQILQTPQTPQTVEKVQKKKTTVSRTTANRLKTQSTKRMSTTSSTTKYHKRQQTTPKYEKSTHKPINVNVMDEIVREKITTTAKPFKVIEDNKHVDNEIKKVEVPVPQLKTEITQPIVNLEFDANAKGEETLPKENEKTIGDSLLNKIDIENDKKDDSKLILNKNEEKQDLESDKKKIETYLIDENVKLSEETIKDSTTTNLNKNYQNDEGVKPINGNEEIVQTQETKYHSELPPATEAAPAIDSKESIAETTSKVIEEDLRKEFAINEEEKIETSSDLKPQDNESIDDLKKPDENKNDEQLLISNNEKQFTTALPLTIQNNESEEKESNPENQQELIIKAINDLINEETSKLNLELEKTEESVPTTKVKENIMPNVDLQSTSSVSNTGSLEAEEKDQDAIKVKVEEPVSESISENESVKVDDLQSMEKEKVYVQDVMKKETEEDYGSSQTTQRTDESEDKLVSEVEVKLSNSENESGKPQNLEIEDKNTNSPQVEVEEKYQTEEETQNEPVHEENSEKSVTENLKEENIGPMKIEVPVSDSEKSQESELVKPTEVGQYIVETNLSLEKKDEEPNLETVNAQPLDSEGTVTKAEDVAESTSQGSGNNVQENEELKSVNVDNVEKNVDISESDIIPIFHRIPEPIPLASLLKSNVLEVVENSEPKIINQIKTDFSEEEKTSENEPSTHLIVKTEDMKSKEFQSSEIHSEAHDKEFLSPSQQITGEQLSKTSSVAEKETLSDNQKGEQISDESFKQQEEQQTKSENIKEETNTVLSSDLSQNSIVQNFPESQISLLLGESPSSTHSELSSTDTASAKLDENSPINDSSVAAMSTDSELEKLSRTGMARNLRDRMDPRKRRFLFRSDSS